MELPRLVARFATADEFLAALSEASEDGGLFLDGAIGSPGRCVLEVEVAGQRACAEVLAGSASAEGVAVLLDEIPAPLRDLAARLRSASAIESPPPRARASSAPPPPASMTERLRAMSTAEKIQLALSGGREERGALLRDLNRALHVYVLKNPRLGLDEVVAAARQATLSTEALAQIGEHPDWSVSPQVCGALVRNPRTPQATALRLIDRLSDTDVRAIAKGNGRPAIVQAARRRIGI